MGILNIVATVSVIALNILSCVADDNPNHDKVTLGFIIDDTGSMTDDIAAVLAGSEAIFDTVIRSPHSPVINYLLSTFNDPTTNFRIVTRNTDEFLKILRSVTVSGGGDCPELCLHGIKQGIEKSRFGSFLYVFTDASAKDYGMYGEVKTMALRKGITITFVLTGMCGDYHSPDYVVFEDLAYSTGGEVFHLGKTDIGDILSYVRYTVEAPSTLIAAKKYPPGDHKIDFDVDPLMKDPLISVTGDTPKLDVTKSDGTKPPLYTMITKPRIKVAKIPDATPGTYSADVGSLSDTTVTIRAHTDVQFKFAFSTFLPPSYKYTTRRPVLGVKSYVVAKLIEGDIELNYVKILDMDFNVLSYTPLSILNVPDKSYVTDYMIDLPKTMFRVAVEGYDPKTKTSIVRIATVPVEPHDAHGTEPNVAPVVTLDETLVKVRIGESVKLYCRVKGLPKPDIEWTVKGPGKPLPTKVMISELPYYYIAMTEISNVTSDVWYQCAATNSLGSDSKTVFVKMLPTHYLKVLEKPKDTEVEYNRQVTLFCRVEAYPPAEITWYKGDKDKQVLPGNNTNIIIPSDKTSMTILSMQPEDEDTYVCEAKNDIDSKWLPAEVSIINVECLIDLGHMYKLQPLVLSPKMIWPRLFTDHGKMVLRDKESLVLYCLRGFKEFSVRFVTATCVGGNKFKVNGFNVDFDEIACNEPMKHVVESTNKKCIPGNTEMLNIGFGSDKIIDAYEVCFDKTKNIPIYTKNFMPRTLPKTGIMGDWKDNDHYRTNFDELYDCQQQIDTISTILGKWFHNDDKCCFRKQKLVEEKDVFPGVAQRATFSYLNVVPIWNTCGVNNWFNLQRAVRALTAESELLVFTGVTGELKLQTIYGVDKHIRIADKSDEGQQVPLFLWKVVQNPTTKSSVAMININVPDLTPKDVPTYVRCKDICKDITWLNGTNWQDETRGYIYCCSLEDFHTAFGFVDVFEPFRNVLY